MRSLCTECCASRQENKIYKKHAYHRLKIKLDSNTLTFEEQIVFNLETEIVTIVNLCMVRKSSEMVNFEGKGKYM